MREQGGQRKAHTYQSYTQAHILLHLYSHQLIMNRQGLEDWRVQGEHGYVHAAKLLPCHPEVISLWSQGPLAQLYFEKRHEKQFEES